jgi:tape measure domain-containing protein
MASVDNRIVKMEFNNGSFEKNAATSLATIEKLNKSISGLGKDGGGLKALADQAGKFNMGGVSHAIEDVSAKFLAMSAIGITALANITNRAIDAGLSITKALTIDQVTGGFAEYELKLGSIQTIMAGTGADLDTVNKKLQELNEYSDKTIYSFADMTQNIGKFTNAGVSLDMSVASIKGVANVAALSGANAEEASRAMYNFAQALSKGHVQLIDWKSIELANMGTVEFKQQLIDAAAATGELTKQGDKWVTKAGTAVSATEGFNESLTDQWLTTEVLTGTLSDYSDATTDIGAKATAAASDVKTFTQLMGTVKESIGSGWAESFEILIGNFDEAKGLWSTINNNIGEFVGRNADARNELLQSWKDMGGRAQLVTGFVNGFRALMGVINPIKKAFRDIFPAMTAERLYLLTVGFNKFMEALIPSEGTMKNISRIFKGFFAVLEIGWTILKSAIGLIVDLFGELAGVGTGAAFGGLAKVGDFFVDLNKKLVTGGGIIAYFDKLKSAIQKVIPFILEIKDAIADFMGELDFSSVSNFFGSIGDAFGGISFDTSVFDPIIEAWDKFTDGAGKAGEGLQKFGDTIADVWNNVISGIGGAVGGVLSGISDAFSGIINAITGIFSAGGDLEKGVSEAADGIDWAVVLGGVGAAMVGGLIVTLNRLIKNGITIDFTGGVLSSISDTFGQLTGVLKSMQQDIKANILLKIAIAIGVLAVSVGLLALIDPGDLGKAMAAIAVGLGQLIAAMALLDKIDFSTADAAKFALLAISFGILSASMVLLAVAMKIWASMDWEDMAKGGAAFASIVGSVLLMSKFIENEAAGMVKASFAMLLMATSMGSMARVVTTFGEMDLHVIVQGFIGLGVAMTFLVGTMALLPDDMEKKTTGLLGFSIALNLMVIAIKMLGNMEFGELVQGGIAFAAMLGLLVLALNKMPPNMGVQAAQILALAAAMAIMGVALRIFGSMGWEEMGRGLLGMAGALIILVAAMTAAQGGIIGAGAILVMSVALLVLASAIAAFSAIGFADFATGMLLVVVALGALAATAYLLTPAIGPMLLLGAALAAIGLGFALIGVAAAQFAKAIATLAGVKNIGGVIVETFAAIGKALPALFTGIAQGVGEFIIMLMGFIPDIVAFGIDMLLALLDGIIKIAPRIFEFIGTMIKGLLKLIETMIPAYVTTGLKIILGILKGIRDAVPQIIIVVGEIIVGFLDALAEALPPIVESVANLFTTMLLSVAETMGRTAPTLMFGIGIAFFTGFFDGISSMVSQIWTFITGIFTKVIDAVKSVFGIQSPSTVMMDIGINIIMGLFNGIVETAKLIWDFFSGVAGEVLKFIGNVAKTLWNKGKDIVSGLWEGIKQKALEVATWFRELPGKVKTWLGDLATTLKEKGKSILGGLWAGIKQKALEVATWFEGLDDKIKGWIGDAFGWLKDTGKNIIEGLWGGVKGAQQWLKTKMEELLSWLPGWAKRLLGISSPSKVFAEIGQWIPIGLGVGMLSKEKYLEATTEDMGNTVIKTMEDTLKKMPDMIAALDINANPTITPVLDLTQITKDAKKLESMLPTSSMREASLIASYKPNTGITDPTAAGKGDVNFVQTINAPKQLATVDIYRQTRNQIAMAKEVLNIP